MSKRLQDFLQAHMKIGQGFFSSISSMLCCPNLGVSAGLALESFFIGFTLLDPTLLPSSKEEPAQGKNVGRAKALAFDDEKGSKTKVQSTSCAFTTALLSTQRRIE